MKTKHFTIMKSVSINAVGAKIGNYTLLVSKAVKTYGHDDSLPYNADFKVWNDTEKKKHFSGKAWNDGWGGDSVVEIDKAEDNEKLKDFDRLCKENIILKWKDLEIPFGIDKVIDFLAELLIFNKDRVGGYIFSTKAINDYINKI